jgi:glycosyltransferase involved in cell wall biosynthesis
MPPPAISIVLPVHNDEDTLPRALDSLLAQTDPDWELLAVDDGSTDSVPACLAAYAQRDPRIRVLSPGRVGIVTALQYGCAEAHAPLIARMDADDEAHPERLARQRAYLTGHPGIALCGTGVSAGGPIRIGRQRYLDWINSLLTPETIAQEIFVECPLPHPTFLIRRAALEAVGGYQDRGWPEDYDLVLRLWQAGHPMGKLPGPLLTWHERPGRLSMRDPRYGPAAFRACKRHYLRATHLARYPQYYQWGAGEAGKPWLREWGATPPVGVVDIRPSKLGKTIHGVPVIPAEALPPAGEAFVVIAVGTPGARDIIRNQLQQKAYREGEHFTFLA